MKPPIETTYPISLDLRDKSVLLVGGGEVAFRKAQGLSRSGCRLTVVAREFSQRKGDQFASTASAKCTNEENYLIQKFTRAVMGSNSIDHCARL